MMGKGSGPQVGQALAREQAQSSHAGSSGTGSCPLDPAQVGVTMPGTP